jgi:hypothetical protein
VTLWDSRERKVLGSIQFPERALDPRLPFASRDITGFTALRFAISGDGKRLAISDRSGSGAVRVYDVSKLAGLVKAGE